MFQGDGTGDVVQGNLIGTDVTGTKTLGNHGDGIRVQDPSGVIIGSYRALLCANIISGKMRRTESLFIQRRTSSKAT